MKQGLLKEYFDGVAVKRLSAVEADPVASHQHEFQGGHLRGIFGDDDRKNIPTQFIWMNDEQEGLSEAGEVSWYDSRRKQPKRSAEYRLYYKDNPIAFMMKEGDSFFVASRTDGTAMIIVVPQGSTIESQLSWLFGIESKSDNDFAAKVDLADPGLDFAARYILDELGIEPAEPEADKLDTILDKYGLTFPKTAVFARIARDSLKDISPTADPADVVLMAWLEREELLFRRLERRIVSKRLETGFIEGGVPDVEGFVQFSLSVQNRRKSRAGHSLEHHVEALLKVRGIHFDKQAVTEGKAKPDFLFPGREEYHDPAFDTARLTMLGAKSTLKDRWRQIYVEADRIPLKHLLTLQPGISEAQTDEMQFRNVQLVVPKAIHTTFKEKQQKWLMNVGQFIELVDKRQNVAP